MKLPAAARFCEDCQSLFFHPATCPGCGAEGKKIGAQKSKYHNQPTTVDGEWFQSKREAERWGILRLWESSGEISNLRRQVPYPLKVRGQLITTYLADFVYEDEEDGATMTVVEDAKGVKTEAYRIKKRLMLAIRRIAIQEV